MATQRTPQRTPHGAMEMIVRSTRSDGTRAEVWQVATREKIAEFCCINHALAFAAAGDYEAALRQIGESLKTLTTDEYSRGGDRQVRDAIASALAYPDRITIIKHDQPFPWVRKARQAAS